MYDRRDFLRYGIAIAFGAAIPRGLWASGQPPKNTKRRISVYKSPDCGCCKKWVEHARQTGWIVTVHDVDDIDAVKDKARIPKELRSCHTSFVGRYVFEGHVPADIMLAFMEKPRGVSGLAVPGMPTGSPGMEVPGVRAEHYKILGYYGDGRTFVYASR